MDALRGIVVSQAWVLAEVSELESRRVTHNLGLPIYSDLVDRASLVRTIYDTRMIALLCK